MFLFLWFSLLVKVTFGFDSNNLGKNCHCSVTGDPHYETFDGQHITFTGHCKYVMVSAKPESTLDPLKVEVKNKKRGNYKIPYTERIDITLGEDVVKFFQHSKVMVNGSYVSLPFTKHEFNVTSNGGVMKLMTKDKVIITFDGQQKAHVTLPLCYAGKVQGLCGDCNGFKDDFRLDNGSDVTHHPKKFTLIGESYKVPDVKDDDPSCRPDLAVTRLRRETMPFSPYDDLILMCNILSTNGHLEYKPAPNNLTVQTDIFRKVCNLMEHFERTICKGGRSVFLTCDAPTVRQRRDIDSEQDYYAVNGTHFIRIAKSDIYGAHIHSVMVTRSIDLCLKGCVHIGSCVGVVVVERITCVYYEKLIDNSTVTATVIPGSRRDAFLVIPDPLGDITLVHGGSKKFSRDMLLQLSLNKCKSICRQCSTCEGVQYHAANGTCMVFIGIGRNGPIMVEEGWIYYGFLNRICSKKCPPNARCLRHNKHMFCTCEYGYVGDGDHECRAIEGRYD